MRDFKRAKVGEEAEAGGSDAPLQCHAQCAVITYVYFVYDVEVLECSRYIRKTRSNERIENWGKICLPDAVVLALCGVVARVDDRVADAQGYMLEAAELTEELGDIPPKATLKFDAETSISMVLMVVFAPGARLP